MLNFHFSSIFFGNTVTVLPMLNPIKSLAVKEPNCQLCRNPSNIKSLLYHQTFSNLLSKKTLETARLRRLNAGSRFELRLETQLMRGLGGDIEKH